MKWFGDDNFEIEEGEPALRSCWMCNPGHEHLKKVNTLHNCFDCGRRWVFDHFIPADDDFGHNATKGAAAREVHFAKLYADRGLSKGDSTTKFDAGYRITVFTIDRGVKP